MHVVAGTIERHGLSPPENGWMQDWQLDNPAHPTRSYRHKCFTDVEQYADQLLRDNHHTIISMPMRDTSSVVLSDAASFDDDDLDDPFDGSYDDQPDDNLDDEAKIEAKSVLLWHRNLFDLLCRPYFEHLSNILKERNITYFILAFDEFSQLNSNKRGSRSTPSHVSLSRMTLIALQCIIKAYDEFVSDVPFWFLLLDNNLSVVDLVRWDKYPPRRLLQGCVSLPLWPFLGFNQMVPETSELLANIKRPTDVLSLQHIKFHGRPVSSTYLFCRI
jgi:hypothetical protein